MIASDVEKEELVVRPRKQIRDESKFEIAKEKGLMSEFMRECFLIFSDHYETVSDELYKITRKEKINELPNMKRKFRDKICYEELEICNEKSKTAQFRKGGSEFEIV